MNRRSKTEKSTASRATAKRTRAAVKKTITKRPQRKGATVSYTNAYSDTDEDFLSSPPVSKLHKVFKKTKPRKITNRIYEISDTSDDEITELNKVIDIDDSRTSDVIIINETLSYPSTSRNNAVPFSNLPSYPSTSNKDLVNNTIKDDTIPFQNTNLSTDESSLPDYIDNLINTCDEDAILRSVRELNEQTDKLLEVSRELLTESEIPTSTKDDSVVYLCTEKYTGNFKDKKTNNDLRSSKPSASEAPKTPEKQIKASCPICLDSLGSVPVSATVCGHSFCTACIKNCVKTLKKCPTCRKTLTMKMIHPLFLF